MGPVHTACVIHGLLGQGKNLRTFTQRLCKRAEEDSGARCALGSMTWLGALPVPPSPIV